MKVSRLLFHVVFSFSLLLGSTLMRAQDAAAAPDNTKVNQRDKNSTEPTADQQKNQSPTVK
jgi:hypothetical protein